MVTITNGTIDWELSCERYALIGGSPPSGWTVKANTCANYARQFNAPFASFGVGGGDGTVRSVALAADEDVFEVSGSPVTDIGTLILALKEQGAGLVFAGPVSGADSTPTFRVLELSDLPDGAVTGDGAANQLAYWDTNETISHLAKSYILPDEARFTDYILKFKTLLSAAEFWFYSDADGCKIQSFGSFPIIINALGNGVLMPSIAGSGTRMVTVAADGALSNAAIPTGYTDEQAQDAVGGILSDSAEIDFTYNDGAPSISAVLIATGVTPGTYTKLTVDSKGRVTSATTLSASDIPNLPASIITSGVLPVARGGTGLSALGTALQYLRTNAGATAMEWATLAAITGTLTAPRIPYASGAGTLTDTADLQWDNTTKGIRAGAGAGAVVGTYTAYPANGNAFYGFASVSGSVYGTLENFWDAAGAGNAYWLIKVGGANAGDPYTVYVISGVISWSSGVDNSDNDIFKIGPYSNPGTGALGLQIRTTGEAALGGTPDVAISLRIATAKPLGIPSGTNSTRATGNANANIQWNTESTRFEAMGPGSPYYKPILSYATPTAAVQSAAGTGATASLASASNAISGQVTLTTGTASLTTGSVLRITVAGNMGGNSFPVFSARNDNAAAQATNFYIGASSVTTFDFYVRTALAPSTTYILNYYTGC